MAKGRATRCRNGDGLQVQLDALRAEGAALREQLAAARQNSATSSKPPSSDIVKLTAPPRTATPPRCHGGQPGHALHRREPFPRAAERASGERFLQALRALFAVIHRAEELPAAEFQAQLSAACHQLLQVGTQDVPAGKHSQNLATRLARHGACYFQFLTTPGVAPTNNLAEQAIRFVVIDRLITQGTRSAGGRQWCERRWTVLATCSQQDRSVFDYGCQVVEAHFHGTAPPSLLPSEG